MSDETKAPVDQRRLVRALSIALARNQFASDYGLTYASNGEFRRSLYAALGYAESISPEMYRQRYRRDGIAHRLVRAYPQAAWVPGAEVVESDNPKTVSEFESSTNDLFNRLGAWSRFLRATILAGLGRFSVIVIGAQGELDTELKRMRSPDDVLFLTTLGEDRARINRLDTDTKSPRFAKPELYSCTFGAVDHSLIQDGISTVGIQKLVHWSRVVHVTDGCLEDDLYGEPALESVWNYLDDLNKMVGGGAEATWKKMDPGMHLDADGENELTPEDAQALRDQMQEFHDGLERTVLTQGVAVKPLSGSVPSISANTETVLHLIAGTKGIPHRLLVGAELGKVASSQDEGNWDDRVTEYRNDVCLPTVRTLVDRLILYGALPAAASGGYTIKWPEADEMSETAKATTIGALATANSAQFSAEKKLIITSAEIRDRIYGLDPIPPADQPAPPPAPVVVAPGAPPGAATPAAGDSGKKAPAGGAGAVASPPAVPAGAVPKKTAAAGVVERSVERGLAGSDSSDRAVLELLTEAVKAKNSKVINEILGID